MATNDDHDTCTCGAHVEVTDNVLRKRARVIGCEACCWTGETQPIADDDATCRFIEGGRL
jgi:hypothetical protein